MVEGQPWWHGRKAKAFGWISSLCSPRSHWVVWSGCFLSSRKFISRYCAGSGPPPLNQMSFSPRGRQRRVGWTWTAHQDHLRLESRCHVSSGQILSLPAHPFPYLQDRNKYQFLWTEGRTPQLLCLKCPVWYPAHGGLRIYSHLPEISLSFILHPLHGHPRDHWGGGGGQFSLIWL